MNARSILSVRLMPCTPPTSSQTARARNTAPSMMFRGTPSHARTDQQAAVTMMMAPTRRPRRRARKRRILVARTPWVMLRIPAHQTATAMKSAALMSGRGAPTMIATVFSTSPQTTASVILTHMGCRLSRRIKFLALLASLICTFVSLLSDASG